MLLAMTLGVTFYQPLSYIDTELRGWIMPSLIFAMLFVTFCGVSLKELRLRPIHGCLILFQITATPLVYYAFLPLGEVVAQGAMVCFLAPIAMAAVAVGALLGANIITLVSYTLVCNIVMSIFIPLYLDIFGNGECTFLQIFMKVGPLLILPILSAQLLKFVRRSAARWVGEHSRISFYMWLCLMLFILARTTNFVVIHLDSIDHSTIYILALVALFACLAQYACGRLLGHHFSDDVAGAQALGQKNTTLTVWLAQTFLMPVSCIAPTAYIIWQNIVNSYQIYRHDKKLRKGR